MLPNNSSGRQVANSIDQALDGVARRLTEECAGLVFAGDACFKSGDSLFLCSTGECKRLGGFLLGDNLDLNLLNDTGGLGK